MSDYVWFRIPGQLPMLPAPFFLGHGQTQRPGYRTDKVRQAPLAGKMVVSIALTTGGQAKVGGQIRTLQPGHAVFHEVHDETNWFGRHPQHRGLFEWLGFMFEGDTALHMAADIRARFIGPYRLDPQAALLRRMIALTKERTHHVTMTGSECMSLTCGLLSMILKAAEGEVNAPQTRHLAETAETMLREAPEKDWTVGELATRCGVSREHLTRAFKEKYGVSPRRYLSELRIQQACARLRGTQEPIKNIMLDLGYTSYATFNRAFRRYTEATPSEYRDH